MPSSTDCGRISAAASVHLKRSMACAEPSDGITLSNANAVALTKVG